MSDFSFKGFWQILKDTGASFSKHNVLKLSASLSYFTIFSIGPMMLGIIFCANLFWGCAAINGTIHNQLSGLLGNDAALQVQEIIKNASVSGNNFAAVFGIVMLIIAATSAFNEMQSSLNIIWDLKVNKGKSWLLMLKNRVISFAITARLGFLLLVSLLISSLLDGLMANYRKYFRT